MASDIQYHPLFRNPPQTPSSAQPTARSSACRASPYAALRGIQNCMRSPCPPRRSHTSCVSSAASPRLSRTWTSTQWNPRSPSLRAGPRPPARRDRWVGEAQAAARGTLALALYEDVHSEELKRVPSRDLLALLALHRQRRDVLDWMFSGEEEGNKKEGRGRERGC
ncbi:hypothetical protein C8R44DRAFT_731354 [Mycena epipterygia]|nr:hypothetical protein C8R44DRAFT_731354 [Mycena epipterygia]